MKLLTHINRLLLSKILRLILPFRAGVPNIHRHPASRLSIWNFNYNRGKLAKGPGDIWPSTDSCPRVRRPTNDRLAQIFILMWGCDGHQPELRVRGPRIQEPGARAIMLKLHTWIPREIDWMCVCVGVAGSEFPGENTALIAH